MQLRRSANLLCCQASSRHSETYSRGEETGHRCKTFAGLWGHVSAHYAEQTKVCALEGLQRGAGKASVAEALPKPPHGAARARAVCERRCDDRMWLRLDFDTARRPAGRQPATAGFLGICYSSTGRFGMAVIPGRRRAGCECWLHGAHPRSRHEQRQPSHPTLQAKTIRGLLAPDASRNL